MLWISIDDEAGRTWCIAQDENYADFEFYDDRWNVDGLPTFPVIFNEDVEVGGLIFFYCDEDDE